MNNSNQSPLHNRISHSRGLLAISPIVVFLAFYLVVSLVIGDFYKMPIAVALMIASVWAVLIFRGKPLAQRIEIFSKEAGSVNILYMIWIFVQFYSSLPKLALMFLYKLKEHYPPHLNA